MFVKNQSFSDEATLLEALFDFALGKATLMILGLQKGIELELEKNEEYQKYKASLTDEEDILELEAEEKEIRLAEALLKEFDFFTIRDQKLYGVKGLGEALLYQIDLV